MMFCRDPTRISLEPFTALTSLDLRGCDLSTANWDGLPLLQAQLRELRVHDTLEALHHLLAPHAVAVTVAGVCTELTECLRLRHPSVKLEAPHHLLAPHAVAITIAGMRLDN